MKKKKGIHRLMSVLILMIVAQYGFAQTPESFTYQAVLRDNSGAVIPDANIEVAIGIHEDTEASMVLIWEETHVLTTNEFGLFQLLIGDPQATRIGGSLSEFSDISWDAPGYYLEVTVFYQQENYSFGLQKLQSVPFALRAKTSEDNPFISLSDTLYLPDNRLIIGTDQPAAGRLSVTGGEDLTDEAPLFEVKRNDGVTLFAVYNSGVEITVPENTSETKGLKGGFRIGGFSDAKAGRTEYDLLSVSSDSIRMYIREGSDGQTKGFKGGFAIGGFSEAAAKTTTPSEYFNVFGSEVVQTVSNSSQMLWYPLKEAFLAGNIHIGSPDSVGFNSTALGYRSVAMGDWSQAFGYRSMALADYATAIGWKAKAYQNSYAFGNEAEAIGTDSYALGSGAQATGDRSIAFGSVGLDTLGNPTTQNTLAEGTNSVALGMGAVATEVGAMSMGVSSTASGKQSLSLGFEAEATEEYATAIGFNAQAEGARALSIGSHALINLTFNFKKGDPISPISPITPITPIIPINPIIPIIPLTIYRANQAVGFNSIAVGNGNYAQDGGMAFGVGNDALTLGALALGYKNEADSLYSVALGSYNQISNYYGTAIGYNNYVSGYYATAMGQNTTAQSYGSFVIGRYNTIAGSTNSWSSTDPLFVVGNGNKNTFTGITTRNNALTLTKGGNLTISGVMYAASYGTISDQRFKDNITDIPYGLDAVMDLRPVEYDFSNPQEDYEGVQFFERDGKHEIGLVAQELVEVVPEAVNVPENEENEFWSIDYVKLVPVLTKAMQEQQAQIESLIKQNRDMQKRIERLEKKNRRK